MAKRVLVLVGTKKGLMIAESDGRRRSWDVRGPYCDTWPVAHAAYDPGSGAIFVAGKNEWWGPAIWKSCDVGRTWTHSSEGLTYGEGADPVANAWLVKPAGHFIYAGVEPAGLFRSADGGATWEHVRGLRDHATCPEWQPGGAGLMVHTMEVDPRDADHFYVGISVAGVFETRDGGLTWATRNAGLPNPMPSENPEIGNCCHHFELDCCNPDVIVQQSHWGMYLSKDAGASWQEVPNGLPSTFGFPASRHPHKSGTYYLAPLNGAESGRHMPDAAAAIYRTSDYGQSWHPLRTGLPQSGAYFGVMRQAMSTDTLDPAGVYFGSSTGHLFASADEGETWAEVASYLPGISSVDAYVIEA